MPSRLARLNKTRIVMLRVTETQALAVEQLAEQLGEKPSVALRTLLREGLKVLVGGRR